ncbi:MAG: F0F1 ATP synthase subunit A [Azospirillaceae bacterium]
MAGPLEQFEVKPIVPIQVGSLDLSFTNSSLWMIIAVVVITAFLTYATSGRALVPTRLQSMAELIYEAVAATMRDAVGSEGRQYFPFVFTLFVFVLIANLLGMIPGSFTVTSHIIVTFALAAFIFVAVTIIGVVRHGAKFLSLFFPHGAPWWTGIILIPVEIVSYLSRPVSLSVRLFANMVVGHVLLKVIGGFIALMGVFGIVPFIALIPLTALEIMIAVIQAYVFTVLTCVYLNDALHLH